jgi:hypothetical protein
MEGEGMDRENKVNGEILAGEYWGGIKVTESACGGYNIYIKISPKKHVFIGKHKDVQSTEAAIKAIRTVVTANI